MCVHDEQTGTGANRKGNEGRRTLAKIALHCVAYQHFITLEFFEIICGFRYRHHLHECKYPAYYFVKLKCYMCR